MKVRLPNKDVDNDYVDNVFMFFLSKLNEILSTEISAKFQRNFANYNEPFFTFFLFRFVRLNSTDMKIKIGYYRCLHFRIIYQYQLR